MRMKPNLNLETEAPETETPSLTGGQALPLKLPFH